MSLWDQVVASFSDRTGRLMTLCFLNIRKHNKAVWRETRQRFTHHTHATYQDLSIINAAFLTNRALSGNAAKRLCPSTYMSGGGIGDAREDESAGTLRQGGGGDKRRSWPDGPRPQACLLPACAASLHLDNMLA